MAIIKKRKLRLGSTEQSSRERALEAMHRLPGVMESAWDPDKERLIVNYDIEQVVLSEIENELNRHNVRLYGGFFSKLRRGWFHDTEQNELDNLHDEPVCCGDPKLPQK